jgi:2-aminobenzoylacetyl-CoA thioesterase
MIIENTGKIAEEVYMLGHPGAPLYLIDGDRPGIVDTGFTFMTDIYAAAIKRILGKRQPAYCLLTHVHFDHCGATAGLKKIFPAMQVVASRQAEKILQKPRAIERIRRLNHAAKALAADFGFQPPGSDAFEPFAIDINPRDGDLLELSAALTVRAVETPGHTRDTISYYLPERRILFASEAAGVQDQTGYIVIDCLLDYDRYVTSLNRLVALDPEVICIGHRYVYTLPESGHYLKDALHQCGEFYDLVCRFLNDANGDIGAVMQRIRAFEYDPKPQPKQPEPAYILNLEARIRAVARKISQTDNELPDN